MADETTTEATHRRILKYPLDLRTGPQAVPMPPGAFIVDIHGQGDAPTIWAEVTWDAEHKPYVERTFAVVGTGQTIPEGWSYEGTAHCGQYVWHVCEVW